MCIQFRLFLFQCRHLFFERGGRAQQALHHQFRVVDGAHLFEDKVAIVKGDAALVVAHVGRIPQIGCRCRVLFYARHHLRIELLKHAGSVRQSQVLQCIIPLHNFESKIRHHAFQVVETDQILAERLVDGLLIHVNGVSHARLVIRKLGCGIRFRHLPHAFALVHDRNAIPHFIRLQRIKHGRAIIRGADEVAAHLRALAHVAQKVAHVCSVFKHVVDGELARRHVEPVFCFAVFAIHAFAQQRLVLGAVPEHGSNDLLVFFAADSGSAFNIERAVALDKQRPRHDAEALAVIQVARTRAVQLVLNVVLRYVDAEHERQVGVDPFRKVAALAHRKVNERVAALAGAPNQCALDKEVVEIAQSASGGVARRCDAVVIHVVVGQLVRNIGAGGQHLLCDRVVNGVPVGIRHMVCIAVILLATAILRRFVGANTQRNPAKARVSGADVVCALNDCAVFNGLVFGRQHHAAIPRGIRAKDDIAHVRIGVIRIRGIERRRFVGIFRVIPGSLLFMCRQLALYDVLARIQIAVLFFVKPDPQRERLVLNHLVQLGGVHTVRVNARHFGLPVRVSDHRGQKVNRVCLGRLPFEGQPPGGFVFGTGRLATRFAPHRRVCRRENHAIGVVFKRSRVNLRHERGAALKYALVCPGVLEFLVFNAHRTRGCTAHDRPNFQFIYHVHQERQPELADWCFCGWRHEMQRAHVLAGNVIHVKCRKQVDEPAVLVVQDVLAIQQRVEQFVIIGLGAGELHAHVGVNQVNATRRTNVKQLARAVGFVGDRVIVPHIGNGAVFVNGHDVLHLKRVGRRTNEMLGQQGYVREGILFSVCGFSFRMQ